MSLRERRCEPCHAGTPRVSAERRAELAPEIPAWRIEEDRLRRDVELASFRDVMSLLARVADLAEAEGHHPDFCVSYRKVAFSVWTHAINGLSENDYVLAARIDALLVG